MGEEKILYADIDLNRIVEGHYARPDVFQLAVNEEEQKNTIWKK